MKSEKTEFEIKNFYTAKTDCELSQNVNEAIIKLCNLQIEGMAYTSFVGSGFSD